ncbi:MAG: SDR family NAD(P)-dependent oxidoreductase [Pirellulales bacterium]|nr:SDR family NAD(P)-dependent oxidoreductase [Pirellulales bacterium]
MRRQLSDKQIVVTGASSGIGRAIAIQLVRAGNQVLALARRQDRLEILAEELKDASGTLQFLAGDITDLQFRQTTVDWVEQHWQSRVDVLINNAGVGSIGPFTESDEDTLRKVMEVNFFAGVEFIRCQLGALRRGRHPVICNVASVLGHTAMPSKSEYCASKFAMHGFSDSLRIELIAEGIDVVLVSPSTTRSEFFDSVLAGTQSNDSRHKGMSAAHVARITVKAIRRGRREVVISVGGKLLVMLDRLLPGVLSRALTRWYHRQSKVEAE